MTDGTKPPETTDPDLATLKRDKELLELRQQIAASRASALTSWVPSLDDAPKGEVTLGEKAGSLAPWLTQRALAVAAGEIAIEVQGRLLGLAAAERPVILVTEDSSLQAGDLVSRQVLSTMTRRAGELLQLKTYVIDAYRPSRGGSARVTRRLILSARRWRPKPHRMSQPRRRPQPRPAVVHWAQRST